MENCFPNPPFLKDQQLCIDLDACEAEAEATAFLPGHPCLKLHNLPLTRRFLVEEFWSDDLETFAPHLWVLSTHSSSNINPLHRQRVKGREIVITEEPRLHLVWYHDRIYIKPLPRYLLSRKFWELFLLDRSTRLGEHRADVRKAALGYLRTYRYLIRHESDFMIAKQDHLCLVPRDVDWSAYCRFASALDDIKEVDVSGRYNYGELRLSRLNFYAPLFLGKFNYEQIHGQYKDYFARLYGPMFFVFAVVSTVLNSMQVGLAVDQVASVKWDFIWPSFRTFSAFVLIGTTLVSLSFIMLWWWLLLKEWIFVIRFRRGERLRLKAFQC